jgi:hypothetical protein
MTQKYRFLGLAWVIIGTVVTVDYACTAWRTWSDIPFAFPRAFAMYLPFIALGLVIIIAGVGYIADKKWAKIMIVVMSVLFLIYGLFAAVSTVFLNYPREYIGIETAINIIFFFALLVPVCIYTLIRFFKDRRSR